MTNVVLTVSFPSSAVTVIVEVPIAFATKVLVRFVPLTATVTTEVSELLAVNVKLVPSTSVNTPLKSVVEGLASSDTVKSLITFATVGASFTALTVMSNVVLTVSFPSSAVTVIVEVPFAFATKVLVRFVPLTATVTTEVSELLAVNVKLVPSTSVNTPLKSVVEGLASSDTVKSLITFATVGASFTALTVMTNVVLTVSFPSSAVTVIVEVPLAFATKVLVRFVPLTATVTTEVSELLAVNVKLVPSTSVNTPLKSVVEGLASSDTVKSLIAFATVGASFTALTVMTNVVLTVSFPSSAVTVIVEVPLAFATKVLVRFVPLTATVTTEVSELLAVNVKLVPSTSVNTPLKSVVEGLASSDTVKSLIAFATVGASFTSLTVMTNVVLTVSFPSSAVTVIVEVPLAFATKVLVRFVPLTATVTTEVSELLAVNVKLVPSTSVNTPLKSVVEGLASSDTVKSLITFATVGASFTALTVMTNVVLTVSFPSSAVTVIVEVPLAFATKVLVRFVPLTATVTTEVSELLAVNVKLVPSTSVNTPLKSVVEGLASSDTVKSLITFATVGASFTALTVMTNVVLTVSFPSSAVTVIVEVPLAFATKVLVRFVPLTATVTTEVSELLAVNVKLVPSTSVNTPLKSVVEGLASSDTVKSLITFATVGASFTALTVMTNVVLTVSFPSSAVTVIVEVPLAFATKVLVRFVPLTATVTTEVSELLAVNVKLVPSTSVNTPLKSVVEGLASSDTVKSLITFATVGASFTALTVMTNVVLTVSFPSSAVTVIVEVPLAFATKVLVRFVPLTATVTTEVSELLAVNVKLVPSTSVNTPLKSVVEGLASSDTVKSLITFATVGASFTALTVMTNVVLTVSFPSSAVTVIVEVPLAFATKVLVRFVPLTATVTTEVSELLAVNVKLVPSTSVNTPLKSVVEGLASSDTVKSLIAFATVGASFTELTVMTNVVLTVSFPSSAVTVIVEVPLAFATKVLVRFVPLTATVTTEVSELLAVNVKLVPSTSVNTPLKSVVEGLASSDTVKSLITFATVGASFTALTVMSNVVLTVAFPSSAVTVIVEVPFAFATKVLVRFVPLTATVTTEVSELLAVNVKTGTFYICKYTT